MEKEQSSDALREETVPKETSSVVKQQRSKTMDPIKELTSKTGGVYIPRAKLREMLANSKISKSSPEYQKLQWEQLKKQLNGLINKANVSNLKTISIELFKLNLMRGKGVFVRSLMKAQAEAYEQYTKVYAALVTIINSKLPEVTDLLVVRLILQFRRSFRRNDKAMLKAVLTFLGELVNQEILDCILIFQIFFLLLDKNPTDDSVEISVSLVESVGKYLELNNAKVINIVYDRFRQVIQEGMVSARVQQLVEMMFDNRRERIKRSENGDGDEDEDETKIIDDGLDLVEFDDKFKHSYQLDSKSLKAEEKLNIFRFDEHYEETEEKYNKFKRELFGDDDDDSDVDSDEDSDSNSDSEDEDEGTEMVKSQIKDLTQTELTNFQKTVYLTIMSSMSDDEASHKLLQLKPIDPERKEYMLIDMVVKCCAQEKTYSKYYGLIMEKLAMIGVKWRKEIKAVFEENYNDIHKFNSNLIRNIGFFWGHILASDKVEWDLLQCVELTESKTNSSSRIFLKFLFQRMQAELGNNKLLERLQDDYNHDFLIGLFPETNKENIRFSINFFTAIGLGILTEKMRELLETLPDDVEEEEEEEERGRSRARSASRSGSDSRSGSGSRSRSYSYSRSRSGSYSSRSGSRSSYSTRSGSYSRSRSRSYSRSRSRSYSRSRSRSFSRSRSRSYSRSPSSARSYSRSRSRTPSRTPSRSRSPSIHDTKRQKI